MNNNSSFWSDKSKKKTELKLGRFDNDFNLNQLSVKYLLSIYMRMFQERWGQLAKWDAWRDRNKRRNHWAHAR